MTTINIDSDFSQLSPLMDDVINRASHIAPSPGHCSILLMRLYAQLLSAIARKTLEAQETGETYEVENFFDAIESLQKAFAEANDDRKQFELLCSAGCRGQ